MDFNTIFQLRTKKFWWMDVIFYFAISVLVATVFCYIVFTVKNSMQRDEIAKETQAMSQIGTDAQKGQEKDVIGYRKKINDFSEVFKNHQFASYAFAFMQTQTMPNVWFKQFALDRQSAQIQLSGEAENLDALSRQVSSLEKNKYVKNLGGLSSVLGDSARIQFNFTLSLNSEIFNSGSEMASILHTEAQEQVAMPLQEQPGTNAEQSNQEAGNNQKLITSFHLLLTPEVIGAIDQTNYIISLDVPYGTNLTNIGTSIMPSPGSTIAPLAGTPQDFTNPVFYTVTASDGSTQAYKVVINVLPQEAKNPKSSGTIWMIILLAIVILAVIGAAAFFVWKKIKDKNSATDLNNI